MQDNIMAIILRTYLFNLAITLALLAAGSGAFYYIVFK